MSSSARSTNLPSMKNSHSKCTKNSRDFFLRYYIKMTTIFLLMKIKLGINFASNKAWARSRRQKFPRLQALFSLWPHCCCFFIILGSLTRAVKIQSHYLYPAILFLKLGNFCIRREIIDSSRVKTVWEGSIRNYVRIIIRHPACAMELILHCAKQDKKRIYC